MQRRTFVSRCAVLAALAPGPVDEAVLWREYVKWYRARPAEEGNARLTYVDELKRRGMTAGEAEERGRILERLMRERRAELQPYFFDRTYRSAEPRFNTQPNRLVVEAARGMKPGRALDVHMGQGRNAVYLAKQGWAVTGFDYSEVGVAAAGRAAREAGVQIDAVVKRHEEFEFGLERWDLVVMTYAWVPLRVPWVERIVGSMRRGGRLVYEQMVEMSGGENAAPWLPRANEVLKLFSALRVVKHEEVVAQADWLWRPERIVRLVAEKRVL